MNYLLQTNPLEIVMVNAMVTVLVIALGAVMANVIKCFINALQLLAVTVW
jgi:hypothetical protein